MLLFSQKKKKTIVLLKNKLGICSNMPNLENKSRAPLYEIFKHAFPLLYLLYPQLIFFFKKKKNPFSVGNDIYKSTCEKNLKNTYTKLR